MTTLRLRVPPWDLELENGGDAGDPSSVQRANPLPPSPPGHRPDPASPRVPSLRSLPGAVGAAMNEGLGIEGPAGRALLLAAAAGDEASSRRLYRENVDRVHRTVVRILGAADGDVDDVVQQTFLAALLAAPRFDGRSKLSTFLIGIASRRALDAARERQRRARWGRLPDWAQALVPTRRERPADLEDRTFAMWALGHLTPEQRQVFVLHEVEGHTLQEIFDMTGTGISTLHARLQAGKKRLDAVVRPADSSGGAR